MLSRRIKFHPCDAQIKFHRNFGNFYLQVCFLENFELATSVFYSIISNFNYLRLEGCCLFLPCKLCIFTADGIVNNHFANFVEFWKTSGNGWCTMDLFPTAQ